MPKLIAALVLSCAMSIPAIATADDAVPAAPAPAVTVTKEVKVVGHRLLPNVIVELTRPTAAHEAGAAHEFLRAALLSRTAPASLR